MSQPKKDRILFTSYLRRSFLMMSAYHSIVFSVVKSLSPLMPHSRASKRKHRMLAEVSRRFQRSLQRALGVTLVVSLLVTSTPAAAQTVVGVLGETKTSFAFWLRAKKLPGSLFESFSGGQRRTQEKQSERDSRVTRLQIFPNDVTINEGQKVSFVAVAYDQQGDPVSGTKVKWSAANSRRSVWITPRGEFESPAPGDYRIIAEKGGQTAEARVVVLPVPGRGKGKGQLLNGRPVSTRDLPAAEQSGNRKQAKPVNQEVLSAKLDPKSRRRNARAQRAHASPTAPIPLDNGEGWNDGNYTSADDPGNLPGDPPGGALDGGAGSANFHMDAPVLSLPGRGMDISLSLAYNSRLWNKAGNQLTYDIDRGWPAPGWSIGFGKLLQMGQQGSMIVDANGTRHSYAGTLYDWGYATYFVGHTTDGTFIDYTSITYDNGMFGGEARFPNGITIYYGTSGQNVAYATNILDPNGNGIAVAYPNNVGPRIEAIYDTVGRVVNFSYNANNLLTAITAPGLGGGTRTLVRLHYKQLSLGYSFAGGISAIVRDPAPWVIDAIYYPGAATGFWMGDADSYSTYGMITKVSERRNMTYSPPSLTDQGTITINEAGQMSREELYNYPLNTGSPGGSGLTNAPTYSSVTESWTRDGTNIDSATTTFEIHEEASPRTVKVTMPNGTSVKQYSYNLPGNFLDGVFYQEETIDAASVVRQRGVTVWSSGPYNTARPTRLEITDDRDQTLATEFSYGSTFNQVTDVRRYDYGGALIRSTRTQYQNSPNYTSRHIYNLPLVVEIFAGDNTTRVARTEYQYDGQTLTDAPGAVGHSDYYNPYAPEYLHSPGTCCEYDYWQINCVMMCPDYWASDYDPSTDYRGNVTQITTYADAATPSVPTVETRRYDITGNVVTTSTACCEQTSYLFTADTAFAYAQAQTQGSASDASAQVKKSATYDFGTGLVLTSTDTNGRTSSSSYNATTLRPQSTTGPSGAHTDFIFDDANLSITETTYLAPSEGGAIADQYVRVINGRGQLWREKALGNGVWDIADTFYDNMGRVSQQSRAYRSGDALQLSTFTYDALSRLVRTVGPDGSTTETYYNEKDFDTGDGYTPTRPNVVSGTAPGGTTLVRDAWGRERWGRLDPEGRLIEVVEPSPSGGGSVATGGLVTTYGYTTLGNLTNVTQEAQTRTFKYDSLGRLVAQKLAETEATLNDSGQYVGSGTWSDVFGYDSRSNLISRTDARGVKVNYNYNNDGLNRLQTITYDTSSDPNHSLQPGDPNYYRRVLDAAAVTYQYRTNGGGSQLVDVRQAASITTSGVSTESMSYDTEGRISSTTLTMTARPSYPFTTDYIFDTVDRITDIRYPAEYGNGGAPRKLVHHTFDVASRLTGLTIDGASHASVATYNAASQMTQLKVGLSGANQTTENYGFHLQTGLLESQTVVRGTGGSATTLLDLGYDYANSNQKRTGQITKILNNLNHNKDRSYAYDTLGRLTQAKGGNAGALWTQNYSYDRYGNRTSVSASGNTAKAGGVRETDPRSAVAANAPESNRAADQVNAANSSAPRADAALANSNQANQSTELAAKTDVDVPEPIRTDLPRSISDSNFYAGSRSASRASVAPDPQGGPPVFTDDPLVAGVTVVKAVHINELRTAVNQARTRASLSAASWAESVVSGTPIKASHIVELRTRLAEARTALGLTAFSYTDPSLSAGTAVKAVHVQQLRQSVTEALTGAGAPIPSDGIANLAYNAATNRITTAGFEYDKAGNQLRALAPGGGSQKFQYDAANRLIKVFNDNLTAVLGSYTYGSTRLRLVAEEGTVRTYYAIFGSVVTAEYSENVGSTTPAWSKSYVNFGGRLLATLQPNGAGGENIQYHHPDRLGTRLVTSAQDTSVFEQSVLPFGTGLPAESTIATNRRFTSYDRSSATGLDYAVNRHYDPQQGRFTQVDPAGIKSVTLESPQTLNLYAYCANDPINHTDPSGLGFFSFLKKLFKGILKHAILGIFAFKAVRNFVKAALKFTLKLLANKWVQLALMVAIMAFTGPGPMLLFLAETPGISLTTAQLLITGVIAAGQIGKRWQDPQKPEDPPEGEIIYDEGDVIVISTSAESGIFERASAKIAGLMLAISKSLITWKNPQIRFEVRALDPKKQFDPCRSPYSPEFHSSEIVRGEVVKGIAETPGLHPGTALGKGLSRGLPVAGGLGDVAPGIYQIGMHMKCNEQMAEQVNCVINKAACTLKP
jgi:RHS repeat-associated protein